jgi:hypothetical protein
MSDADKGEKPAPKPADAQREPRTAKDAPPKSGLVTPGKAKGQDAEKLPEFKPGPGPDDPSVPYDDGSDRDDDAK